MKKYFLTFASESHYGSLHRLAAEACKCNVFDEIRTYNDLDLKQDNEFWNANGRFIETNKRGYGYWLWKPYLVCKTLAEMSLGDVLVYCDSGCTLNSKGKSRLQMYMDRVSQNASGLLGFAMQFIEKDWCKRDLLLHLSCEHLSNTPQIMATTFVMRKCAATISFAESWFRTATACNYKLIDDSPSTLANAATFREHRHDQSIFSLLFKISNGETLTAEPDHHEPSNPIWATRRKATAPKLDLPTIGSRYGTDKVSHGFCRVYDDALRRQRFAVKNFLEVGVFFGASMLMWRDFFPNALISGIDTFTGQQGNGTVFANADAFLRRHQTESLARIALIQLDQSDRNDLQRFSEQTQQAQIQYDIILDDASHLMKDQQQTLALLFPLVKPGGHYIVEDLHTSNQSGYDVAANGANSTLLMLQTLARNRVLVSQYMNDQEVAYLLANIAAVDISFVNGRHSITGILTKKQ